MLKGVSQKVIEVVHTDNRYFEKAILFLRPTAQDEDKAKIKAKAGEYLAQIHFAAQEPDTQKYVLSGWIKAVAGVLVGAACACAYFWFL